MRRGFEFDVQSVDPLRLQMPAIKEPHDEDDMLTGTTSARTARDASHGAGASDREPGSVADTHTRPRGRGSAVERCLHDRPRPQANVTSPCGSTVAPMRLRDTRVRSDSRGCKNPHGGRLHRNPTGGRRDFPPLITVAVGLAQGRLNCSNRYKVIFYLADTIPPIDPNGRLGESHGL
jgi:hypothetical protein